MSGQDHPDIENLPGNLHGIPVKEEIRKLFQDEENGTPDNITIQGCVALAKTSILKGSDQNHGSLLWNHWRTLFPVDSLSLRNQTNFQGIAFNDWMNFSFFEFGLNAKFEDTTFKKGANFQFAKFGNGTNFSRVISHHFDFDWTQWGSSIVFSENCWEMGSTFMGAQFESAFFSNCDWKTDPYFMGASWSDMVLFINCHFNGLNMKGADWDFLRSRFYQSDSNFSDLKNYAMRIGSDPTTLGRVEFDSSILDGEVDFSDRKFKGATKFKQLERGYSTKKQVVFKTPPKFHNCLFHQDTTFAGAEFPKPTGQEENVRAYRTLKLAFSNQQATREQQRFFKLEMAEEGLFHRTSAMNALRMFKLRSATKDLWCWFLILIYRIFADYGFSILRPFFFWCLSVIIFAYIYGSLSGYPICFCSNSCEIQAEWLKESLIYSMPFSGLDKFSVRSSEFNSLCFLIAVFIHKAFSIVWFFLIGLALRNFFKLK